eukprot:686922-Prymnesium_polylepis.1
MAVRAPCAATFAPPVLTACTIALHSALESGERASPLHYPIRNAFPRHTLACSRAKVGRRRTGRHDAMRSR